MKAKYAAIEAKKKELDPKGILNPGMWTPPPWLLRPPVYRTAVFLGRAVDAVVPRMRQRTLLSGSRKEFADCVQCGYCMGYCPTHQEWLSSTPRGRILAARERLLPAADSSSPLGRESVEDIFECTLCGRCKVDCSVRIKSPEMWTDLRCELSRAGYAPEALKTLVRTIEETHNLAAKPNEQRGRWLDALKLAHRKQTAETAYFVGCVTSFYPMVQDVARSFAQILNKAGTDFAILGGEEWCCGYPLLSAGEGEKAANHIESNIDKLTAFGARRIVTTCTGCYRMWKQDYPRITGKEVPFEVLHSTQVISSLIERGSIDLGEMKARVTYHDPCDLGRNAGMYDEPRSIISRIPGVEFVELESNREYCNCCGSGGDLLASNQALSLEIAGRKVKEVLDTGAESVVTACPSCIRAITMARLAQKAPFTVQDISQLVWKAMRK
jgi:Fe-S oxidoreductase